MTVFKGYMKILKKNIGLVIIYLVIFFSVAMALQAAASKEHLEDFEKARVDIAVADNDQSTLSHALTDYLKTIHNVSEISSDPSVMQEELFYRNAEYIVQIPKDFYKTCIVQDNPISVTKIPGSYTSFYVDQQINAWLIMCAHTLLLVFLRKKLQKPLWNSLLPGFPCIRTPKPLPKHRHIPIISVMFPICF